MIQHLVLMTVAAPLMLLAAPRRAFLRLSTQPLLCWLAGTACVIWWHIPVVFEFGQRTARWHQFEMATFFVAGLLFWWPVVQRWPNGDGRPKWLLVIYLFLATLPCDALSAFLAFCGRVVYATDGCCSGANEGPALRDQEIAGALMWAWVTFAYTIPAVIVAFRTLSGEPRPKRLLGSAGVG